MSQRGPGLCPSCNEEFCNRSKPKNCPICSFEVGGKFEPASKNLPGAVNVTKSTFSVRTSNGDVTCPNVVKLDDLLVTTPQTWCPSRARRLRTLHLNL